MLTKSYPFLEAINTNKVFNLIKKKKFKTFWYVQEQLLLKNQDIKFSESFKDLFKKMIYYRPHERISLEKILEHEWVQKASSEKHEVIFDFLKR